MMYLIGRFRLILRFDIRTDKFFGIVIKIAHLYGFQGSWNVIPRMLAKIIDGLVERGGHNPLEPAAHAIPVLMGPHTFNFKDICAKLQQADGLITVTDADSVVKEVSTLLTDEDYRLWYGRHAVEVLHQNQGALTRLLQLLQPYLPQRSH